jgi:hypothetical protein
LTVTLEQYSEAKRLPIDFLRGVGLRNLKDSGAPCILIPYYGHTGEFFAARLRLSLDGPQFRWRTGDRKTLYMLDKLKDIRQAGWVLLVEGAEQETNALTMWFHGLPALGVPGNWQSKWKTHLSGINVFIWQGNEDFANRVGDDIPDAKIIMAPPDISDVNEAHLKDLDVRDFVERLKGKAVSVERLRRQAAEGRLGELREQAKSVLDSDDPLELIRAGFRELGYGGDLRPPTLVYLAATSRLLKMRHGQIPAHVLALGPSSVGKSYTLQTLLMLMPSQVVYKIDAGSPAVLVYEEDYDFRHKFVLFSESDSLPGEDNPIASAIRNLLQDHQLKYKRTVPDKTAKFGRRSVEVIREGPTVLLVTSTRKLGRQLGTRLFTVEMSEDTKQVKEALDMQAVLELSSPRKADPALIVFQEYLQELAPCDVIVPFVRVITGFIGESPNGSRILRDMQKILSLIKSVAIVRREHRSINREGQLVAEIDDYAVIHQLVEGMYEATVTNVPQDIRKLVQAVRDLNQASKRATDREVARYLGWTAMRASRCVKKALKRGWLQNVGSKHMFDLSAAKELPEEAGLPHPDAVRQRYAEMERSQERSLSKD